MDGSETRLSARHYERKLTYCIPLLAVSAAISTISTAGKTSSDVRKHCAIALFPDFLLFAEPAEPPSVRLISSRRPWARVLRIGASAVEGCTDCNTFWKNCMNAVTRAETRPARSSSDSLREQRF